LLTLNPPLPSAPGCYRLFIGGAIAALFHRRIEALKARSDAALPIAIEPLRCRNVSVGLSAVAGAEIGDSAIIVDRAVIWLEPDRVVVVADGVVVNLHFNVGQSAIVVGRAATWLEPDRVIVVADGLVVILHSKVGQSAIVVGAK